MYGDETRQREIVLRFIKEIGIKCSSPEQKIRELSGGNQQKVVLSRWLLRECRVLLLDEPTRGVDIPSKAEIYRIVTELAGRGLGVVLVSSELEELAGICTRVLVMREGELVAEVDGDKATERELLSHAVVPTTGPDLIEEVA